MTDIHDNVIAFPTRGVKPAPPSVRPAPQASSRYVVRVDLDDSNPAIWRRLEFASDLTLEDLHDVLQTAMGWTDSHLHQFLAGPERTHTVQPFLTDFAEEEGDEGIHEKDVRVDQVLARVGDRLFYDYDFGDGWDHTLLLEGVAPYDSATPRARVLDGDRACPPEDCGGIGGYEEVLAALAAGSGTDRRQRELLEWLPDAYDPEGFAVSETDALLQLTLSRLGGASGVESLLALEGRAFSDPLADLVLRSRRDPRSLSALLADAELTRLDEPDAATKAQAVRPWQHLLVLIGSGLKLTAAGWMPPTVVSRLATDLDLLEAWMGKGNREDHFAPVRRIRDTATQLGLVRKRNGMLLPTLLGTRLADDPAALWRHVADSVPLGTKDFERDSGVIMLAAVAAGHSPYDGIRRFGPDLLSSAGWSRADRTPPDESDAIDFAQSTWFVLMIAAGPRMRGAKEKITHADRQLARAALLRS